MRCQERRGRRARGSRTCPRLSALSSIVHLHVVNARHRHIERFQFYCLRLYEAKQPVEQDGVQHGAQNILGVPAI
jgi:hypothetical protein